MPNKPIKDYKNPEKFTALPFPITFINPLIITYLFRKSQLNKIKKEEEAGEDIGVKKKERRS